MFSLRLYGPYVVPFFGGVFGLLFLFIGARRIFGAAREPDSRSAVVSGVLGIGVGVAFFAAVAWLVSG